MKIVLRGKDSWPRSVSSGKKRLYGLGIWVFGSYYCAGGWPSPPREVPYHGCSCPSSCLLAVPWAVATNKYRGYTSRMRLRSSTLQWKTDSIEGPLNATAPYPVSQREFAQTLGKVLGCPAFLPTPAFALRFMMGEMAQALLLEGQRVLPRKLMQAGFRFRFPTLSEALGEILSQQEL